jgi:hypothetical protein
MVARRLEQLKPGGLSSRSTTWDRRVTAGLCCPFLRGALSFKAWRLGQVAPYRLTLHKSSGDLVAVGGEDRVRRTGR